MTTTGAGGAGFLLASAFTCINCTACGFCTAAAVGAKRPKAVRDSHSRKATTVVIESVDFESLAVSLAAENWDKDILQRRNLFLLWRGGNLG